MARRTVEHRKLSKVSVGDMRERISIETRVTVPPDFDQPENTVQYTVLAEVWAKVDSIMYQGAGEQNYNRVNLSKIPALKFSIRFRADVNSFDHVVRWRDQLYKIDKVDSPEERLQYTNLISVLRGADDVGANQ